MSRAGNDIGTVKYILSGGVDFGHRIAPTIRTTIMVTAKAPVRSQGNLSLPFAVAANGAVPAVDPPLSQIHFSSLARSLALCHLSSATFARHFLTTWSNPGGVIGLIALIGCGSF